MFPGRQEFHVACPDEETWLLCLLLGGDCLKIPNRRQTAALPGKVHAALGQTAMGLDGDKVGDLIAILIPVDPVRSDPQDDIRDACRFTFFQFDVIGQIAN